MKSKLNKGNKFINDTLKNPDGVWSFKRVLALFILIFDVLLGIWIVISDFVLIREINRYAIDVFVGFLAFVLTLLGYTELSKKFANKIGASGQSVFNESGEEDIEEPREPHI